MTFEVLTEAGAERDWYEAALWYDERSLGLGDRLNRAIREVLQTLATQPERYPLATRLTRKAKVPPPWPYTVYFTVDSERRAVRVLAVWHGARNPADLHRRLR